MQVKLTHVNRYNYDFNKLLNSCQLVNTYCHNIEKLATELSNGDIKKENDIKGDCFEIFVEFLCLYMGTNPVVGIIDYKPNQNNDFGVDGYGKGLNGKPATVQAKYRQAIHVLTHGKDDLVSFLGQSYKDERFKVDINDKDNMLLITSGKEVHYSTLENMLWSSVRVLNREKLRALLDNNVQFWQDFKLSWENSL